MTDTQRGKPATVSLYRRRIKRRCQALGTYKPEFDPIIEKLAQTLILNDKALQEFEMIGGQTVIRHTNKAGATNLAINPALQVSIKLNQQELQLRETLGLTPRRFKKLQGDQVREDDPLREVLNILHFEA